MIHWLAAFMFTVAFSWMTPGGDAAQLTVPERASSMVAEQVPPFMADGCRLGCTAANLCVPGCFAGFLSSTDGALKAPRKLADDGKAWWPILAFDLTWRVYRPPKPGDAFDLFRSNLIQR